MLTSKLLFALICGALCCYASKRLRKNYITAMKNKKQSSYGNQWRDPLFGYGYPRQNNINARSNYGRRNAISRRLTAPNRGYRGWDGLDASRSQSNGIYRPNYLYEYQTSMPPSFQSLDSLRAAEQRYTQNNNDNYNQNNNYYNNNNLNNPISQISNNNQNANFNQNNQNANFNQNNQNANYNQNNQNANYNQNDQNSNYNNQNNNNQNNNSNNRNSNYYQNIHSNNLFKYTSCNDWHRKGKTKNGPYSIKVGGMQIKVFCEFQIDGHNWVVFQKRIDGSVDFFRNWTVYENGFGNITGDFWLGLKSINLLTISYPQPILRIDLEDFEGNRVYAEYSYFLVESRNNLYRMRVDGYSGNAGDSLSYHNGAYFSTLDRDNDQDIRHLAVDFHGAWWYNNDVFVNLNGAYLPGGMMNSTGIGWFYWKGNYYSMKSASMKIRPSFQP